VFDADRPAVSGAPAPEADAGVTRRPGPVLAVLVADCMPVLLCRRDGRGVAIAHAGWRGLAGGVLEAAVQALGGDTGQVIAWLGPAIGPAHFEVGDEVRAAFCARGPDAQAAFERNERGRWQCDLYALATQRLQALGVAAVFGERLCTFRESERFYSFRRDRITGRFAALIWMEAERSP
jgi:YfiH family protein